MRHTLLVIITLLTLCAASCSRHYDRRLTAAEDIMAEHPDSALSMLQAIDHSTIESDKDRALYALLMSQALDKNYIDATDDSLISIAVDYYSHNNDKSRYMLSQYYLGRVCFNEADYPRSLFMFFKTMQQAKELGDPFWAGMSARSIMDVYDKTFNAQEAIAYAKMSYDNLKRSDRKVYADWALWDIAKSYHNNGDYRQCINTLIPLLDSLASIGAPSQLQNDILSLLGTSSMGLHNYNDAVKYFEQLRNNGNATTDDLAYLGKAYINIDNTEKALEISKNISDKNNITAATLLYELSIKKGDTDAALTHLNRVYFITDSILHKRSSINFVGTITNFYDNENKIKAAELKTAHVKLWLIVVIALLAFLTILFLFWIYKKRQQVKHDHMVLTMENLHNLLSKKNSECMDARYSIQQLMLSRYETLDKLCQTYYEGNGNEASKKRIFNDIVNLIEQISNDPNKITELEEYANKYNSDIMKHLRSDLENLKYEDCMLFLFSTLGFSISTIALFLKEEKVSSIYNRKARLKRKIQQLSPEQQSRYHDFLA